MAKHIYTASLEYKTILLASLLFVSVLSVQNATLSSVFVLQYSTMSYSINHILYSGRTVLVELVGGGGIKGSEL